MATTVAAVAVVVIPMVALVMLLRLANALQEARDDATAAQAAVTDAIHRELGAVVAPTITPRRGGWRLQIAVPFRRPRTIASVVSLAHQVLSGVDIRGRRRSYEIVLTPQRETPRALTPVRVRSTHRVA